MAELSAVRAKVWLLQLKSFQGVRGRLSFNVSPYFEDPHFFAAILDETMELYGFLCNCTYTLSSMAMKAT